MNYSYFSDLSNILPKSKADGISFVKNVNDDPSSPYSINYSGEYQDKNKNLHGYSYSISNKNGTQSGYLKFTTPTSPPHQTYQTNIIAWPKGENVIVKLCVHFVSTLSKIPKGRGKSQKNIQCHSFCGFLKSSLTFISKHPVLSLFLDTFYKLKFFLLGKVSNHDNNNDMKIKDNFGSIDYDGNIILYSGEQDDPSQNHKYDNSYNSNYKNKYDNKKVGRMNYIPLKIYYFYVFILV